MQISDSSYQTLSDHYYRSVYLQASGGLFAVPIDGLFEMRMAGLFHANTHQCNKDQKCQKFTHRFSSGYAFTEFYI